MIFSHSDGETVSHNSGAPWNQVYLVLQCDSFATWPRKTFFGVFTGVPICHKVLSWTAGNVYQTLDSESGPAVFGLLLQGNVDGLSFAPWCFLRIFLGSRLWAPTQSNRICMNLVDRELFHSLKSCSLSTKCIVGPMLHVVDWSSIQTDRIVCKVVKAKSVCWHAE